MQVSCGDFVFVCPPRSPFKCQAFGRFASAYAPPHSPADPCRSDACWLGLPCPRRCCLAFAAGFSHTTIINTPALHQLILHCKRPSPASVRRTQTRRLRLRLLHRHRPRNTSQTVALPSSHALATSSRIPLGCHACPSTLIPLILQHKSDGIEALHILDRAPWAAQIAAQRRRCF